MNNGNDVNLCSCGDMPIDDSVGIDNYFSVRRVGEFRKVTTGGGKFRQSGIIRGRVGNYKGSRLHSSKSGKCRRDPSLLPLVFKFVFTEFILVLYTFH